MSHHFHDRFVQRRQALLQQRARELRFGSDAQTHSSLPSATFECGLDDPASRHLLLTGFLMRPLPNGSTLARPDHGWF